MSEQEDDDSGQLSEIETQDRFSSQEGDEEVLWAVDEITGERAHQYKVKWSGLDPKTNRPWAQSWVPKKDVTLPVVDKWRKKKKEKEKGAEKRKSLNRRGSSTSKRTSLISRKSRDSSGTPLTVTAKPTTRTTVSSEISTKTARPNTASASTSKTEDKPPPTRKRRHDSVASTSSVDLPDVQSIFSNARNPTSSTPQPQKKKRKVVHEEGEDNDTNDENEEGRDWPTHLPSPPPLDQDSRKRVLALSTASSDFSPGFLVKEDESQIAPAPSTKTTKGKGKEREARSDDEYASPESLDRGNIGPPPRRGTRVTRTSKSSMTKGGDQEMGNGIAHPDKTPAYKSATRTGLLKRNTKSKSASRTSLATSNSKSKSSLPGPARRTTRQPLFSKGSSDESGRETGDEEDQESDVAKPKKLLKKEGDVVVVKRKGGKTNRKDEESEEESDGGESEVSVKRASRHASSKPPSKTTSNPFQPPPIAPTKRNQRMVVEVTSPVRAQEQLKPAPENPPPRRPAVVAAAVAIPTNDRKALTKTHSRHRLSDGAISRLRAFDKEMGMEGYPIPEISDPIPPAALPETTRNDPSHAREALAATGVAAGPSRSKVAHVANNRRTGGNDSEVVPGTETQSSQSQSQPQTKAQPPAPKQAAATTHPRAPSSTNPPPTTLNTLHAPTARKMPTSFAVPASTTYVNAGPSSRPLNPPIPALAITGSTSTGSSRPPSEPPSAKALVPPAAPPLFESPTRPGTLVAKMKPRTPGSSRTSSMLLLDQEPEIPKPLLEGVEYPGGPLEGDEEDEDYPAHPEVAHESDDQEMDVDVESESEEERQRRSKSSNKRKSVEREEVVQDQRAKEKVNAAKKRTLKPLRYISPASLRHCVQSSASVPAQDGRTDKAKTVFGRLTWKTGQPQRTDPIDDSIESFTSPEKKKNTSMGRVLVPSSSSEQPQPAPPAAPATTAREDLDDKVIHARGQVLAEKVRQEKLAAAATGVKKRTMFELMKEQKAEEEGDEAKTGKESKWDSSIRQFSSNIVRQQQQRHEEVEDDQQPTVEELESAYVDLSGGDPEEEDEGEFEHNAMHKSQDEYDEEAVEEEVTIEEDADGEDDDEIPQLMREEEEETTQDIMREIEVLRKSRSRSKSSEPEGSQQAEDDDDERSVKIQRQEARSSVPPEQVDSQQEVQDSQEQEGEQLPVDQDQQDPDQYVDDDEGWSRRPDRDHEQSQPVPLDEDPAEIQSQEGTPKRIVRRRRFSEDMDEEEGEDDPRPVADEPVGSYRKSSSIQPSPIHQARRRSLDLDADGEFEELPATASSAAGTNTPALMSYEAPPSTQPETLQAALTLLHAKSEEVVNLERQIAREKARNDLLTSEKEGLEELLEAKHAKEKPTASQPQTHSLELSESLSQLQTQLAPQSQMLDVDMESQPPAFQLPMKSAQEEELERQVKELQELLASSRTAWDNERFNLEIALKSAQDKYSLAEKDKETFRAEYMRASGYATSLKDDNSELQKQVDIAQSQVTNGVNLVKATFEGRLKELERDRNNWQQIATFAREMEQRTNGDIRRRAAEQPELERRCRQLESKFVDLRTEIVDLELELESKSLKEEEWANEKMEWEKEREEKDEELRIWKERVDQLERAAVSRTLNGKATPNDHDLVFRCLWRPQDSDNACDNVFLSTQDLEQHMYDARHIHD